MPPTPIEIPALLKALHLFALIVFFAGTFHIVRLYIAHRTAMTRWEPDRKILLDQFVGMERRALYMVIWPALVAFVLLGAWILSIRPDLLKQPFMHVLLGYLALLLAYHLSVHRFHGRLKSGEVKWSAFQLMMWSQLATLFLFVLVVLLIFRDRMDWMWGSLGLLAVGGVVMLVVSGKRGKSRPEEQTHA
ncbi:MAG: CopD family protein [Flavobacteriales bacterium]|nr:CopD family protein [Flavobacteriales bacterium]